MKIICIGRNYSGHAKELQNEVPDKPVVFLKPATALLKQGAAFYLPDWSTDIQYECELVLRICKQGKYIAEQFAHKYYNQISVGIDFTARDLQRQQKSKGLPWEIAKSFDNSAVVGTFSALPKNKADIGFHLLQNDKQVQRGNSADMVFSFEKIIAYASQFFTLQVGDLVYTGTPAGVGAVRLGDVLQGFLENEKRFEVVIK